MSKNCIEGLAEWAKKREASRSKKDKSTVAFLAIRADVKAAIEAGYALKTVWEYLREMEKISYRYETFLRHVRRYIMQKPTSQVKRNTLQQKAGAITKQQLIHGFTFNPIPNKEDLI